MVAPVARNPGEKRMAIPVGEVAGVFKLAKRRKRVPSAVCQGATHPHRRLGRHRSDREILGHSLDEPEGKLTGSRQCTETVGPAAAGDVVLKGMNQLMTEHMVEVAESAADR